MVHTPGRMGDGDGPDSSEEQFPWHLGVYDAHCHPTDVLDGLKNISKMNTKVLTIMSSRVQDQELVSDAARQNGVDSSELESPDENKKASPCRILPSFGWHPWFSHQMIDDTAGGELPSKIKHYKSVITPEPDDDFIKGLEETQLLSKFLSQTKAYLEKHPGSLVGEIGLDRSMRIPQNNDEGRAREPEPGRTPGGRENRRLSPYKIDMKHQQKILLAQLRLAGEMGRAVSVHGVGAHGYLYETLSATWKGHERKVISKREQQRMHPDDVKAIMDGEAQNGSPGSTPYPPRICLHSFSGSAEAVQQYNKKDIPAKIFFSFSQVVNFAHGSSKSVGAIKQVPDDRLLIESDMHCAGEAMDELLMKITHIICEVKGWSLEYGVKRLADNWKHFAFNKEPPSA